MRCINACISSVQCDLIGGLIHFPNCYLQSCSYTISMSMLAKLSQLATDCGVDLLSSGRPLRKSKVRLRQTLTFNFKVRDFFFLHNYIRITDELDQRLLNET